MCFWFTERNPLITVIGCSVCCGVTKQLLVHKSYTIREGPAVCFTLKQQCVADVCSYNFNDLYNIQTDLAFCPQMAYILSSVIGGFIWTCIWLLPFGAPLSAFINLTSWSCTLKAERVMDWEVRMVSIVPENGRYTVILFILCFMSRQISSVPVYLLLFHFVA